MPNTGCGYPINPAVMCGEWSVLTSSPFLCAPCQAGRRMLASVGLELNASEPRTLRDAMIASGSCEACLDAKATSARPQLCAPCRAEYDRDLAAEARIEGDAGSRCSSGCGYCGRCGGA